MLALRWSEAAASSAVLLSLGLALGVHHATWARSVRQPMFLWPGVAAAGCGLMFASILWIHHTGTAHPTSLIAAAFVGAGFVGLGLVATLLNWGAPEA